MKCTSFLDNFAVFQPGDATTEFNESLDVNLISLLSADDVHIEGKKTTTLSPIILEERTGSSGRMGLEGSEFAIKIK